MVADVTHIVFGVPYRLSTTCFAGALAAIFAVWSRVEGTLSNHSIDTRRREMFYWAAVSATFALGTAAGDMTATTLSLGYFMSGLNDITAFWFAYVMTRPLGASFADRFGKPRMLGGLGYGSGAVSVVLTVAIVIVVGSLAVTRIDVPRDAAASDDAAAGPAAVPEIARR